MSDLSPDARIQHNPDIMAAAIDGEYVLLHISTGHYYSFDEIASSIWERIEKPTSLQTLQDWATSHYQGEPKRIQQQLLRHINRLRELKLIQVADNT